MTKSAQTLYMADSGVKLTIISFCNMESQNKTLNMEHIINNFFCLSTMKHSSVDFGFEIRMRLCDIYSLAQARG